MIYRKLQINFAPMRPHDEPPCAEMEIFAYCPETRFPESSGAAAPPAQTRRTAAASRPHRIKWRGSAW
jgi:hypothetical protein